MKMPTLDFANIMFAGPCNRWCPDCIGHQLPARLNRNNLDQFPPSNIFELIDTVNRLGIRHIIFTATNTDPQLYCCEIQLLDMLRERVLTGADYALHTNGVLALKKMNALQHYDKATISVPSFNPETYTQLMGSPDIPDVARIIEQAGIPIKLSMLLTEHNVDEVPEYLKHCANIGIQRVVLRRRFGESREWTIFPGIKPRRFYCNNPVYNIEGVEVTYWNFETTSSTSINLFSDGTLRSTYLLAHKPEARGTASDHRSTTENSPPGNDSS